MMGPSLDRTRLIFIHGMDSSSQGYKARLLRELFPGMQIPDFRGSLDERMAALESVLAEKRGWTIIGSSLGGLMGAMFTCDPSHTRRVRKLILLAPALIWPDFAQRLPQPVDVPTVIYHGRQDDLIPLETLRPIAERIFNNLTLHVVDDDHGLQKTAQEIGWINLVQ